MSPDSQASDVAPADALPLALGYWVRLTSQIDRLQASVDDVLSASQASESKVQALLDHLTDPDRGQALEERLANLLAGQEVGQEQWQALAGSLNELGQTVAKLSRTQFKSNALAEVKDEQVASALGVLRDVASRGGPAQEARTLLELERAGALSLETRGEFAADLLPALDGLEMALDSGRALLARGQQNDGATPVAQVQSASAGPARGAPSLLQRLAWASFGRRLPAGSGVTGAAPSLPPARDEMTVGLGAWLQGLEMVRTRFLGLLATADIQPVPAEGQPFDPRVHLAMGSDSLAGLPDGAVVAVLRQGYRQRGRVIRYAEVIVNHATSAPTDPTTEGAIGDQPGAEREDHAQPATSDTGSESDEQ